MNLCRCPVCHARIDLISLIQDSAGRDMLTLIMSFDKSFGTALAIYISLFRPAKSDLRNDRALRLMYEVLAISEDKNRLEAAMVKTYETLRNDPSFTIFRDHKYLQHVFNDPKLDDLVKAKRRPVPAAHQEIKQSNTLAPVSELMREHGYDGK